MKKTQVHVRSFGGTVAYKGWETEVPGLVCYNKGQGYPGSWALFLRESHRMPWALIHEPTGCWIASLYKRDQCVELANRLGKLGQWGSKFYPPAKDALQVCRDYYGEL